MSRGKVIIAGPNRKTVAFVAILALLAFGALATASAQPADIKAIDKAFQGYYARGNYPAAQIEAQKLERLVKARFGRHELTTMKKLLGAAMCLVFSTGANACGSPTANKGCYSRTYDLTHLTKHPYQIVMGMRIVLSPEPYEFELDVQFRDDDKDKWVWGSSGICDQYGPGMNCGVIEDGCEPMGDGQHFYITKNQKALYLYPKKIQLEGANEVDRWARKRF